MSDAELDPLAAPGPVPPAPPAYAPVRRAARRRRRRSTPARPRPARRHPGGARRGGQGRRRPGRHAVGPGGRAAGPGPRAARGRARRGQDAARQGARRRARPRLQAGPVHARPHAVRRHRPAHLRRGATAAAVPVPGGPGVHQRAAGRRDQPHAAEDPGRAARGDGGAPGDVEGDGPPAARPVHRRSPPRTRSSTRAPTRCPRPSSTASCSSWQVGYPSAEQEQEVLARHDRGLDPHDIGRRRRPPGGQRRPTSPPPARQIQRHPGRARRCWPTSSRWPGPPATAPSLTLGVSPRGAAMLLHAAKAWAWLAGRAVRHPRRGEGGGQAVRCATASSCAPSSSSRAPPPTACSTASSPRCPVPR